jgi:subtilase family serine protease
MGVAAIAVLGATGLLAAPALASSGSAPQAAAGTSFVSIRGSLTPTNDPSIGAYSSSSMSVEVVLAPSHESQLQRLLVGLYTPKSATYGQWLAKGQFDARFAPSGSEVALLDGYLRKSGLEVTSSSSPFLVRATGPSSAVASAFRTSLRTYRDSKGVTYFSNTSSVELPATIAGGVLGVVGLTDTVRLHTNLQRMSTKAIPASKPTSCETGYVTTAELFAAVNSGTPFPYGYGAGPGCTGLSPSQDNSIYDAPDAGPSAEGAGVTLAVFELAAYQQSDIAAWTKQFYGSKYKAPLTNVYVDGGSLDPACPSGDTCQPASGAYAGDIEVDADIQMQLAISPDAKSLLVYDAPNDETGQTELDEYDAIAKADTADVVSSSWGECENDAGAAYAEAENVIFEQMAVQGQSMFSAGGDTGAFDCIRDGTGNMVDTGDPSSQPWVTSVGGTSLGQDNPGMAASPSYPRAGTETVWNVDDLCNTSADEGSQTGIFWCTNTGAGAGGNSQFWGRPFYQFGAGVDNPLNTVGNGTTQCSLANVGTPCRQVPDVSTNADEYTPYAEYCTGTTTTTPGSSCAGISATGWFGIGGTSLATPFWSAIIADRDGYSHHRTGNANPLLYQMMNVHGGHFFHDINGIGQTTNNNGLFPVTRGYDMATGIGTPIMASIILGQP